MFLNIRTRSLPWPYPTVMNQRPRYFGMLNGFEKKLDLANSVSKIKNSFAKPVRCCDQPFLVENRRSAAKKTQYSLVRDVLLQVVWCVKAKRLWSFEDFTKCQFLKCTPKGLLTGNFEIEPVHCSHPSIRWCLGRLALQNEKALKRGLTFQYRSLVSWSTIHHLTSNDPLLNGFTALALALVECICRHKECQQNH